MIPIQKMSEPINLITTKGKWDEIQQNLVIKWPVFGALELGGLDWTTVVHK